MIPILYESPLYKEVNGETVEVTFDNGGIGWLKDCIKCTVTEELNGSYECEFSYPITGQHYSQITPDRIIKVKPNETSNLQLFRIYRQSKPINGVVKFYCQHISYDLNTNMVTPFAITSNTNVTSVLTDILEHCYYAHRFTAVSQSGYSCKFNVKTPVSARKCIGGMEGSILDRVHGEFEFDNFIIRHYSSRGQNNGVVIQYGKNLTDITADTSIADTYTSIYPYATDENGDYYELSEKVIELQSNTNYGEPRTLPLDLSDKFDSETQITETLLRQYANAYIAGNNIDEIKQNIKISFVQLWQAKEYETIALLERVALGDIVTIKYAALGVSVQAKVIKTVYDVLSEKYIEIEVGQAKSNFADTLNKVQSDFKTMSDYIRTQPSLMEKAIAHATERITGGLGGYVIIGQDTQTGYPEEILIMDTPDKTTATNVWRFNSSGLGHSHNGYNGPFDDVALTDDGQINANMITTGVLNADLIKSGMIEDVQQNMSINMANGDIKISADNGKSFEIWTNGATLYSANDDVLASMFISANGRGVLTGQYLYIGTRGAEKGSFYESASGKAILNTDFLYVNGIEIYKNSNGRLTANTAVVGNFSIEDSNGNEIGSFYESASGKSILSADKVYSDEISAKTSGSKVQITNLSSGIISLVTNGNEVGSFYVNVNGQSYLRTDALQLGNYQYAERNITIDGVTYNVLARI